MLSCDLFHTLTLTRRFIKYNILGTLFTNSSYIIGRPTFYDKLVDIVIIIRNKNAINICKKAWHIAKLFVILLKVIVLVHLTFLQRRDKLLQ